MQEAMKMPKRKFSRDNTINHNSNEIIRNNFVKKLTQLFKKFNMIDSKDANNALLNNIWILNQFIVPLSSQTNSKINLLSCGHLKIKYSSPENDFMAYGNLSSNKSNSMESNALLNDLKREELTSELHNVNSNMSEETDVSLSTNELNNSGDDLNISNFSIKFDTASDMTSEATNAKPSHVKIIQKSHVHTCFACNHLGITSTPLVIFPRSEFESNVSAALQKTTCIEQTPSGDLNSLRIFFNWLKAFAEQQRCRDAANEAKAPILLLVNAFLYKFLFKSSNSAIADRSVKAELTEYCKSNNLFILFYPLESQASVLNRSIFVKFKEVWKQVLLHYTLKDNPHTQMGFVLIYKQVIRILNNTSSFIQHQLGQPAVTIENPIRETFLELFRQYTLPLENYSIETMTERLNQALKASVATGLLSNSLYANGEFKY